MPIVEANAGDDSKRQLGPIANRDTPSKNARRKFDDPKGAHHHILWDYPGFDDFLSTLRNRPAQPTQFITLAEIN
jgi:hypothetical protein